MRNNKTLSGILKPYGFYGVKDLGSDIAERPPYMFLKWYNSGHALCIPGTEQWHNIQAIYLRCRERLTSCPKKVQSQVSVVISRHDAQLTWAEWLRGSQEIDGRISGWPVSLVETPINRTVVFRTSNGQTVGPSTGRMPLVQSTGPLS